MEPKLLEPKWLNGAEPDDNGDYVAVIENTRGVHVSTFKGKSIKEVADKILESQAEANLTIRKLMRPDSGRRPLKVQRKELTPDDRFRLATEMTDPAKVVDAVTEIVTAKQGIAPDVLGSSLEGMDEAALANYYQTEARAFVNENPDYYPDDGQVNMRALFAELEARGWDLTRNNLSMVYQSLNADHKMIAWPTGDDLPEPEPPAQLNGTREPNPPRPTTPNIRPRSISTGIRGSDANATAPPPPKKQKLTRADIERMPRTEYMDRLRDPAFRKEVDALV